jgi:sugar phosphate isomerase/epimerase
MGSRAHNNDPAGREEPSRSMEDRLGLNLHRDGWPTPRALAQLEEAGFRWIQVHAPPRPMLVERALNRRHARALRAVLDSSALRLVLHAPDDLSAGTLEHDRAFDGLLDYAAQTGAELIPYHGLNFVDGDGPAVRERARLEEASLARLLPRAHTLGTTIAIENLAPVHPGPRHLAHDPLAVRDLVRRLDSPAAGMLLDVGHMHITADASLTDPGGLAAAVAPDVALFHVHDNLGARRHDLQAPGIDPLKLDLHLPPGRGCLPWARVAPALRDHDAPLTLEIELSQRPALPELAAQALRALAAGPERAAA